MKTGKGLPNEDLYYEDAEQWLRIYLPDLSEEQLDEQLRRIRVSSLLDFYQAAQEIVPAKFLEKLPRIPKILSDELDRPVENPNPHTP